MDTPETLSVFTKQLIDEGKLLEAGFNILNELIIPTEASKTLVDDMRLAYMAGAHHLWSSIMFALDSCVEETPEDLERMNKIQAELAAWAQQLEFRLTPTEGGVQ